MQPRRVSIGREAGIAVAVLAVGMALSGCIGFKGTPHGKQKGEHSVQVSFKGCAGGSDGCSDTGDSDNGDLRFLAAVRVPQGTVGPLSIKPKGLDVKLKPDQSYGDELTEKAPTPDGTIWMAYSSKVFDWEGDPGAAKAVMKFGLPNHPGKVFRYRPVLGYVQTTVDDDPIDCGDNVFSGLGTVCVDAPDTEDEAAKNLKIKLD